MVTWKRASRLIAALAVIATMTACGSQPLTGTGATGAAPGATGGQSSPAGTPGSSPPGTAGNSPAVVVHLTAGFSPATVRLRVGQQFLLAIGPGVRATVLDAAGCGSGTTSAAAGGLLSVRCTSGGYLYTAEHSGTGIVSATVRPRCSPGKMCPQWLTVPQLHLTIS